jgi:hypothetical protein
VPWSWTARRSGATRRHKRLQSRAHNDRIFLYAFDLLELSGVDLRMEAHSGVVEERVDPAKSAHREID